MNKIIQSIKKCKQRFQEKFFAVTISSERVSVPEGSPPVEVKVRSTVAEEFSSKLLISKADEILLLEDFIKTKVQF